MAPPEGWGPADISAKRTSEKLNTLGVLGLASQRSFLQHKVISMLEYHIEKICIGILSV